MTISRNSAATKKCTNRPKKPQQNAHQQVEDGNGEDGGEDANDTPQTMWTGVPRRI